jgi:hypothetical protein
MQFFPISLLKKEVTKKVNLGPLPSHSNPCPPKLTKQRDFHTKWLKED